MSIEKWYWEMTRAQRALVWILSLAFCFFMGLTLYLSFYAQGLDWERSLWTGLFFCLALGTIVLGCLLYAHLGKEKYLRK